VICTARRLQDPRTVEALQALPQHGPVVFFADGSADVDDFRRIDVEEIAVIGEVMDRAKREAVDHGGHTLGQRVGHDVSGLDELAFAEGADGAPMPVCTQDIDSKALLVETYAHLTQGVSTSVPRGNWASGLCIG
jgi:hypothetical protein